MNAFDYAAPQTVDEAVSLLSEGGDEVGILAGGSDIITQLKEGRRKVNLLLDVKKIPEAKELNFDSSNGLRIGAAVPCCEIYENEDMSIGFRVLALSERECDKTLTHAIIAMAKNIASRDVSKRQILKIYDPVAISRTTHELTCRG